MKRIALASLLAVLAGTALAQNPPAAAPAFSRAQAAVLCDSCGTVQEVKQEKRKGKGGAVGIVGGAVVGGLLGNQVGGGTGKTLATVGGAVGGAVVGNEIQKQANSKMVWVTRVQMKDGTLRNFEQDAQPGWTAGQVVKVNGNTLVRP